jgi:hypothetical protein
LAKFFDDRKYLKNLGDLSINANLQSNYCFQDILLFVPTLATTTHLMTTKRRLEYRHKSRRQIKKYFHPKLQVSGIGSTKINASGRITGLPNADKAQFDLVINQFEPLLRI